MCENQQKKPYKNNIGIISVFDSYLFTAIYLTYYGNTKIANKNKTNKHLSKIDTFFKASKRQQYATKLFANYLMLLSQYAIGFSTN